MAEYAWCEPSWATTTSRIHIREVSDGRLYLGGGIPTPPLCGWTPVIGGWDIPGDVTRERIRDTIYAKVGKTCRSCALAWGWREPEPKLVDCRHPEDVAQDDPITGQAQRVCSSCNEVVGIVDLCAEHPEGGWPRALCPYGHPTLD